MTRDVTVVPHTHWDREWYASFQTFRLKLVDLIDELLPRLEADGSFGHFMLDGQMAVVDDYLAVRPDAAPRLRELAEGGRLAMGPWYILMDEFLVSGETIIRNLHKGMSRAADFGGPMRVGYLPDMFGHIAQMPQILALFGIEQAVVWRGVPRLVDRDVFWWSSPDGSTVRTRYLPQGYGNGAQTPREPARLVRRVDRFMHDYGALVKDDILWMAGTDHEVPRPWLGEVVEAANRDQDEYRFSVASLAEYLSLGPTEGLTTWQGELRSGARANLLMGVLSNRVDVKQAAIRAEASLEQFAEPLAALFGNDADWPEELLDEAWTDLVHNSAHDSICACSIDEVCDAVLARYAAACSIGKGLGDRALATFAARLNSSGPVIVNPGARPRAGLVELDLPGVGEPEGHQLVREWPERAELHSTTLRYAAVIVERELSIRGDVHSVDLSADDVGSVVVGLIANSRHRGELRRGEAIDRLRDMATATPDSEVTVILHREPRRRVLAISGSVPGFGWKEWQPVRARSEVSVSRSRLGSDSVEVTVAENGTWAVDGHSGQGRLVDDGDAGDTYNYCPPARDTVVDTPEEVDLEILERGPLRGRLAIRARYRFPEWGDEERRHGSELTEATTVLEVRADESLVRVETSLDNRSRDHRLRIHFTLPDRTSFSIAECAFTTVKRGLDAEGGPTEAPLPTFPSRRFVSAGGLTVIHEGLHEYELVDVDPRDGTARRLALTLLRSTGMLSRGPMPLRPLPAGPEIPLEGSQMLGAHRVRYALHVGSTDPYELAEQFSVPLRVVRGTEAGDLASSGQHLAISGAQVSAVYRRNGKLYVRVFNPTDETTTVDLGDREGWLVDLLDQPLERFSGRFPLQAQRIATAVIT